jgi:hypothetical protein
MYLFKRKPSCFCARENSREMAKVKKTLKHSDTITCSKHNLNAAVFGYRSGGGFREWVYMMTGAPYVPLNLHFLTLAFREPSSLPFGVAAL